MSVRVDSSRHKLPSELVTIWAKIRIQGNCSLSVHPLLCHMIDVAQVARAMWLEILSGAARDKIARCFRMDHKSAGIWVSFLAGLHDLGKASPAFQLHPWLSAQTLRRIRELLEEAGLACPPHPRFVHHGAIAAAELPAILATDLHLAPDSASRLATLIGGHHGIFPNSSQIADCENSKEVAGGSEWRKARSRLVRVIAELFGASENALITIDNATAMAVAGLVSVADWIGSSEQFFRYENNELGVVFDFHLEDYMKRRTRRALP